MSHLRIVRQGQLLDADGNVLGDVIGPVTVRRPGDQRGTSPFERIRRDLVDFDRFQRAVADSFDQFDRTFRRLRDAGD